MLDDLTQENLLFFSQIKWRKEGSNAFLQQLIKELMKTLPFKYVIKNPVVTKSIFYSIIFLKKYVRKVFIKIEELGAKGPEPPLFEYIVVQTYSKKLIFNSISTK